MIITIDGNNGSGKTTQTNILAKALNLTQHDELYNQLWGNLEWIIRLTPLNKWYSMEARLFNALQIYHSLPDMVIIQRFWNNILPNIRCDDKQLNCFRRCLSFGDKSEPTASFFLNVPPSTRRHRIMSRGGFSFAYMDESEDESNRKWLERFNWLENCLPYFHIIDGTMSVETVTAAMLERIHLEK